MCWNDRLDVHNQPGLVVALFGHAGYLHLCTSPRHLEAEGRVFVVVNHFSEVRTTMEVFGDLRASERIALDVAVFDLAVIAQVIKYFGACYAALFRSQHWMIVQASQAQTFLNRARQRLDCAHCTEL